MLDRLTLGSGQVVDTLLGSTAMAIITVRAAWRIGKFARVAHKALIAYGPDQEQHTLDKQIGSMLCKKYQVYIELYLLQCD